MQPALSSRGFKPGRRPSTLPVVPRPGIGARENSKGDSAVPAAFKLCRWKNWKSRRICRARVRSRQGVSEAASGIRAFMKEVSNFWANEGVAAVLSDAASRSVCSSRRAGGTARMAQCRQSNSRLAVAHNIMRCSTVSPCASPGTHPSRDRSAEQVCPRSDTVFNTSARSVAPRSRTRS